MESLLTLLDNFTLLTQWGHMNKETAEHLISVSLTPVSVVTTAFFNNRKMTDAQRVGVSFTVALVLAFIQTLAMGKHFADFLEALAIIVPLQAVVYRNFALKLGIRALENNTSAEEHRDSDIDKPLPTSSTLDAIATIKEVDNAQNNTPIKPV